VAGRRLQKRGANWCGRQAATHLLALVKLRLLLHVVCQRLVKAGLELGRVGGQLVDLWFGDWWFCFGTSW
jgi:hypothetical protein